MKSSLHKKRYKLWALFLFVPVLAMPSSAKAAKIQNLSCQPQTIEVESYKGYEPVTIAPYASYEAVGQAKIRFNHRELTVDFYEEYVIWNDDTIWPQNRLPAVRGGGFL